MGLEFWQVYYRIGFEGDGAYAHPVVSFTDFAAFRLTQLPDGNAQPLEVFIDLELLCAGEDVAPGGRIAHEGPGAEVFEQAGEFEYYYRMRLCGMPAGSGGDEVGLDKNAVAAFYEFLEAAEKLELALNRFGDRLGFVSFAPRYCNFCIHTSI
jgi:hypothetical protein